MHPQNETRWGGNQSLHATIVSTTGLTEYHMPQLVKISKKLGKNVNFTCMCTSTYMYNETSLICTPGTKKCVHINRSFVHLVWSCVQEFRFNSIIHTCILAY